MSETEKNKNTYFKDWYTDNAPRLNQTRRERYQSDPEYRQQVLQRNQEARERRKAERLGEKAAEQQAVRLKPGSRAWKAVEASIQVEGGQEIKAQLYTIGALAKALNRSVQAIRLWERNGTLPPTPLRSPKNDRLYTQEMLDTYRKILEAQGRLDPSLVRMRSEHKGREYKIHYADGMTGSATMFRVGALAEAVGREVVTLEQLEQKGFLPETPFRASKMRYRLYTGEMIETVRSAFLSRGGEIRGDSAWAEFRDEVLKGWTAQKVMGATLM